MRSAFIAVLLSLIPFGGIAQTVLETGREDVGDMGNSVRRACLSKRLTYRRYRRTSSRGNAGILHCRADEQSDALDYVNHASKGRALASLLRA